MKNKNDITGDKLVTKTATDAYRDGWDAIFGEKITPLDELLMEMDALHDELCGIPSFMRDKE